MLGIGKKTQRKIKRKLGKTTKAVGTFGRKFGDDISTVGTVMVRGAPATGVAAPVVAGIGSGLMGTGTGLKVAGIAEQSIRKARKRERKI